MKIPKLGIAVAVALGLVGAASASSITWSYAQAPMTGSGFSETLAPGAFDTSGVLVSAQNMGGWSDILFDGIMFAATSKEDVGWPQSYDVYGLDDTIQDTGVVNGSTVTLSGLTEGQTYRIQVLAYEGREAQAGRVINFDGDDSQQYAFGTSTNWGSGLLATGTFTADAAGTKSFTVGLGEHVVNAMTVYAIEGILFTYSDWATSYGLTGGDADQTADLEPDGMDNLTEYALGGDPGVNDAASILPTSEANAAGDVFTYIYNRRLDATALGLTYRVGVETDLADAPDWEFEVVTETGAVAIDDEFEQVTNTVDVTEGSKFLRLEINLAE